MVSGSYLTKIYIIHHTIPLGKRRTLWFTTILAQTLARFSADKIINMLHFSLWVLWFFQYVFFVFDGLIVCLVLCRERYKSSGFIYLLRFLCLFVYSMNPWKRGFISLPHRYVCFFLQTFYCNSSSNICFPWLQWDLFIYIYIYCNCADFRILNPINLFLLIL